MDSTGIKEIHNNAAAIALAEKRLNETKHSVIALPENFELRNLEGYQELRNRIRALFTTHYMESFAAYFLEQSKPDIAVYVDPSTVSAICIFDLGDTAEPGHCEHRAKLVLDKTPEYKAFLEHANKGRNISQRDTAEFIEDYAEKIKAYDAAGDEIPTAQLVKTIRNMDIEAAKKSSSAVGDYSESRTAMESIEAKSQVGPMPAGMSFTCKPYEDLELRTFTFRLRVRPRDPVEFSFARCQPELDDEAIANDFAEKIVATLDDGNGVTPTTHIGKLSGYE